jgi:hypothetical protein
VEVPSQLKGADHALAVCHVGQQPQLQLPIVGNHQRVAWGSAEGLAHLQQQQQQQCMRSKQLQGAKSGGSSTATSPEAASKCLTATRQCEHDCRKQHQGVEESRPARTLYLSFSCAGWFCRLGRRADRRPVSVLRFSEQCTRCTTLTGSSLLPLLLLLLAGMESLDSSAPAAASSSAVVPAALAALAAAFVLTYCPSCCCQCVLMLSCCSG